MEMWKILRKLLKFCRKFCCKLESWKSTIEQGKRQRHWQRRSLKNSWLHAVRFQRFCSFSFASCKKKNAPSQKILNYPFCQYMKYCRLNANWISMSSPRFSFQFDSEHQFHVNISPFSMILNLIEYPLKGFESVPHEIIKFLQKEEKSREHTLDLTPQKHASSLIDLKCHEHATHNSERLFPSSSSHLDSCTLFAAAAATMMMLFDLLNEGRNLLRKSSQLTKLLTWSWRVCALQTSKMCIFTFYDNNV